MNNPLLIGIVSWIFPGAGHLAQRRLFRGLLISAAIWGMFIVGIASGGAYYPGFDFKDGALLYLLNIFARFGSGLGAVISYFIAATPSPQAAAMATFEYGGRFVEVAGLLNYLAVIDAVDIALRRKE